MLFKKSYVFIGNRVENFPTRLVSVINLQHRQLSYYSFKVTVIFLLVERLDCSQVLLVSH